MSESQVIGYMNIPLKSLPGDGKEQKEKYLGELIGKIPTGNSKNVEEQFYPNFYSICLQHMPSIVKDDLDFENILKYGQRSETYTQEITKLKNFYLLYYKRLNERLDDNHPLNRIVFGAPGTGKSYKLEQGRRTFENKCERVTFHPDYSYAQFVGTYKPISRKKQSSHCVEEIKNIKEFLSDENKTDEEKYNLLCDKFKGTSEDISYEFVPGPFTRVLVKALQNPQEKYLLLIEEINRANVAAVFGDVFQLLDRDSSGSSIYPIAASEDLKNYLDSKGINGETIFIPSNMYIWATMNSADQGVFPMDTAFKRRWQFEYIGINDNEEAIKDATVVLGSSDKEHKIIWNDLRHAINDYLADLGINEDKQLGPYFIEKSVLDTQWTDLAKADSDKDKVSHEISSKVFNIVFKSKVLMYLFEDAARHKRQSLFSGVEGNRNRYSSICNEFNSKGMYIFDEKIWKQVSIIENHKQSAKVDK